jgi:alkylation response protein AidB-like acyl-CoA dehydrogenase
MLDNAGFRLRLAEIEMELKALEMTQLRVVSDERKAGHGGKPNPASSILKIKGSEIQQRVTELVLELAGPYALPYIESEHGHNEPPIGPAFAAAAAPMYFNYRKVSIYGGSNEIQRNIIAKAILGF